MQELQLGIVPHPAQTELFIDHIALFVGLVFDDDQGIADGEGAQVFDPVLNLWVRAALALRQFGQGGLIGVPIVDHGQVRVDVGHDFAVLRHGDIRFFFRCRLLGIGGSILVTRIEVCGGFGFCDLVGLNFLRFGGVVFENV